MKGAILTVCANHAARTTARRHLGVAQPKPTGHEAQPVDVGQGEDGTGDGVVGECRGGGGCSG